MIQKLLPALSRIERIALLVAAALLQVAVAANAATWAEVEELNAGLLAFSKGTYSLAIEQLMPLAKQGEPTAELVIGKAFAAKDNDSRDCQAAKRWLRLSAQASNAEAPFELALLYQDKTCGVPDEIIALHWYEEAYKRGWVEAATAIGEILLHGADYPDFVQETQDWFVRGAKGLDGTAALRLGQIYQNGLGRPRDMAAAFTWYDFAERHLPVASEDRELALFLRDRIREQFTPAEVARFLERERSIEGRAWLEPKEGS